ncbi:hypothetical protein [Arthrobacter celericrescens]|uniref:hypothetical protein n=1 Tax=Arthrobacter celericrescens TaxID=2320851 RepID=UPI0013C4B0F0|nr:hypothetical protein [Arthrobacter celericrescens]
METWQDSPAWLSNRRGKVDGQLSFELEGPTGFLEAQFKPERGALFLADSWSSNGRIRHLIKDTPDHWTHHGWSPTAQYRSGGKWVPIADALEEHADAFNQHPSGSTNLRGRWRLGHLRGAGISIAAELCRDAIRWWDANSDDIGYDQVGPNIEDFCAVFPTLTARRTRGDSEWHLVYTTDTAAWTRFPGGRWSFAGNVSARDKISTISKQNYVEGPWREYAQLLRKRKAGSAPNPRRTLREQETLAEVLSIGTEFPLILPLLEKLLTEAPTGRWTFDLLSKYTAINARAGVNMLEGQDTGKLHVQNDFCRWITRGERWVEIGLEPPSKSTISIDLPQLTEAALSLTSNPRNASQYWAKDLQTTQTWVITDTEAKRNGDFPLLDVVRGTSRNSSAGWRYFPGLSGWMWQEVDELHREHHLPRWEGDDRDYADKTVVPVSDNFGLLLQDYQEAGSPRDCEELPPMWSDFLHWIQAES